MKMLIQELKQFYIPPLLKIYYERIALEKIIFNVPLFVRISEPESWLINKPYQKYKLLSKDALQKKLTDLKLYLSISQDGSIFEGNKNLLINDSIPYIEWQYKEKLLSSTDLLGRYTLFIELSEINNGIKEVYKVIEDLNNSLDGEINFIIIGAEKYGDEFINYTNVMIIEPDKIADPSFINRFKFKNKSGLTLFNFGSKPYFLVNESGKLMTFYSRQEHQALIDDIVKQIKTKR